MKNLTINVGDYVRTRAGIDKIKDYIGKEFDDNVYEVNQNGTFMPDDCFKYFIFESDIIKSSPNIIDLIEVGDYVNGIRVDEIKNGQLRTCSYYDGYICHLCSDDEIKSIATKEQMKAMEYKIEK